jgi:hypothetical protein
MRRSEEEHGEGGGGGAWQRRRRRSAAKEEEPSGWRAFYKPLPAYHCAVAMVGCTMVGYPTVVGLQHVSTVVEVTDG